MNDTLIYKTVVAPLEFLDLATLDEEEILSSGHTPLAIEIRASLVASSVDHKIELPLSIGSKNGRGLRCQFTVFEREQVQIDRLVISHLETGGITKLKEYLFGEFQEIVKVQKYITVRDEDGNEHQEPAKWKFWVQELITRNRETQRKIRWVRKKITNGTNNFGLVLFSIANPEGGAFMRFDRLDFINQVINEVGDMVLRECTYTPNNKQGLSAACHLSIDS